MTDQADMEARAREMLAKAYEAAKAWPSVPRDIRAGVDRDVSSAVSVQAMLSYAAEREAAAYARAAEVARKAWVPSYVRVDRSDSEKWEPGSPWDRGAVDACNRIATAIEALGEAKG